MQLYKVSVLESVKYPELIVTVKAHDADAVLTEDDKVKGYSEIRYTLRGENSDLFKIDNVTGAIQVNVFYNIFMLTIYSVTFYEQSKSFEIRNKKKII